MTDDNPSSPDDGNATADKGVSHHLTPDTEFDTGWTLYQDDDGSWFVAQERGDGSWTFLNDDGDKTHVSDGNLDDAPSFDTSGHAQLAHKKRNKEEETRDEEAATDSESPLSEAQEGTPPTDNSEGGNSDDLSEALNDRDSEMGGDGPLSPVKEALHSTGLFQGEENEDIANFDWSEEAFKAKSTLENAYDGDKEAIRDAKGMPRRILRRFRIDPNAREDFLDTALPLSLSASGFGLFLTALVTENGSVANRILTTPSQYADVFLLSSILMMVSALGFWVSRKSEGYGTLRRGSRWVLGALQLIPFTLFTVFFVSFFLGGGVDMFVGFERTWLQFKHSVLGSLPGFGVGGWYAANSPLGLTIRDTAILMLVVGSASGIPFLVRVAKITLLAMNEDPRKTLSKMDMATFNREASSAVNTGDEGVTVGLDGDGGASVGGTLSDFDWDGSMDALLALPDEMKTSPYKDYEEVRRYWVKAPYAYVSIVYNDDQNDHRYVVVEPDLDETERALIEEFDDRLSTALLFEDIEKKDEEEKMQEKVERLERKVLELASEYNIKAEGETFHKLLYFLERNYIYYNKIDPFMNDPHVEDISCDGDGKFIFVFHQDYKDLMTNVKFERDTLRSFIVQLAQRSGEHISAAEPMCDASLPDGSRAQLTLGSEITTKGSTFTIRRFREIPFTPVDLLKYRTFDVNQMAYLWMAIEHDKSLIFAGGTASGKTTSMNAVSLFIPPKAKVVTLEDTREINLPHDNWIPGTTRDSVGAAGGEEIDMYNLLESALRQRPEYMVVGEIRGDEAQTLFQAMSTGHTTYSTMHADTAQRAIGRLTNPPINVPRKMIESLDILCIQQQVRLYDEDADEVRNVRRNLATNEIIQMRDDGSFQTHQPYRRDPERDEFIEQLDDSHVLDEIREEQGWTHEELNENLKQRKEILMYLVDNNITEFKTVARTIQAYMVDSETVVEAVRNDTLEPESFKDITNVEYADPNAELRDHMNEDLADSAATSALGPDANPAGDSNGGGPGDAQ